MVELLLSHQFQCSLLPDLIGESLAAILNTLILEVYFAEINGTHLQVNAFRIQMPASFIHSLVDSFTDKDYNSKLI